MGGIGDGASAVGGGIADGATSAAGAVADAWNEAGNTGSPWNPRSPAFGIDVLEGAAGAVWGVGELAWQGVQSTNQYARIDPEGSEAARQGFADGAEYAWGHPWETAKQVLGIHHFENGEPGKFTGEFGITALATLASGGTAAAARGASGASRAARAGDDVADAGRAARAADDVSDVRDLGRIDYSSRMGREVDNFAEPKPAPVTASRSTDEWLVNIGDSSRAVGDGRSIGWWVPLDEARGYTSIDNIRDRAALPDQWYEGGPHQAKDEMLIARVPAGEETTRLAGRAAPQPDVPDPRAGGGRQIFFQEFDAAWIEARVQTDDFLAGREPELPGLPPR